MSGFLGVVSDGPGTEGPESNGILGRAVRADNYHNCPRLSSARPNPAARHSMAIPPLTLMVCPVT